MGELQGSGQLTFPNGDIYKGEFIKSKANGFGEFIKAHSENLQSSDIKSYIGYWQENLMHGSGR